MLEIRQYTENVWEHVDTVRGLVFSSSAFNFDLNNGIFQIKEINGQNRFAYNRAQIRVFPLGGGEESFSTDLALHQRLRELNYTPFQFVIPEPVSDWEVVSGALQNKDNSLNMLFRFLSQKGLTIETPSGSPDWKVLRLLNSAVERFSLTQNGHASLSRLSASDFLQGLTVRFGEGILHFLTQIQYANSSAANVRNAQLDSTGYTAAGGGGMLEYKFFSTDRATLRRELRLLCNLDLKRIDLHTFPGFTPINSTSETLIRTILIPANTLDAESAFELYTRFNFTDATQTKSLRLRHSTTAGFSTAHTLIGTNNVTAATLFSPLIRTFRLSGGNLTGFGFNVSSANDIAASGNATGSTTFNPAVDNYIHISGFVANTSASITPTLSIIEKIIS